MEKGAPYPDITLLSALVRLLKTDLNTLLSFQEDLSNQEIADFLGNVYTGAMGQGMTEAFAMLNEKVREYLSCEELALNGEYDYFCADGRFQEFLSWWKTEQEADVWENRVSRED